MPLLSIVSTLRQAINACLGRMCKKQKRFEYPDTEKEKINVVTEDPPKTSKPKGNPFKKIQTEKRETALTSLDEEQIKQKMVHSSSEYH